MNTFDGLYTLYLAISKESTQYFALDAVNYEIYKNQAQDRAVALLTCAYITQILFNGNLRRKDCIDGELSSGRLSKYIGIAFSLFFRMLLMTEYIALGFIFLVYNLKMSSRWKYFADFLDK